MPLVEVQPGRRLNVVRRGEGPPLLLIQGMSGNVVHWGEPFLAELQERFTVVAFDHRGVGWSERVTEPFTIVDLADDAARILDAVGIERAHVMGISMGGMVAQELALSHRGRVDRLVLGCTYCGGDGSRLIDEEAWRPLGEAMAARDPAAVLRASFELNLSAAHRAREGAFEEFSRTVLTKPAAVRVITAQLQAIHGHDTRARLPSLDVPTLVLHGTEDRILDVLNGRLIASLVPGARYVELEGAGHLFWWEQGERVLAELDVFLPGDG